MSSHTVFIASDHAGFPAKALVAEKLESLHFSVQDLGPTNENRVDYPDFADQVCHQINLDPEAKGVLICGSGQGMAMRANKYPFIRAALCWNSESASLARQHNNANVLCLGARLLEEKQWIEIVNTFFTTEFEGGRHQARVEKISKELK